MTLATLLLGPADSQAAGRRLAGVEPASWGAGRAHRRGAGRTARRHARCRPFPWSRVLEALPAQPAYPADQRSRPVAVKPSPSGPSAASREAVGLTDGGQRSYAVACWELGGSSSAVTLGRGLRDLEHDLEVLDDRLRAGFCGGGGVRAPLAHCVLRSAHGVFGFPVG